MAIPVQGRIYRRTAAGGEALASEDTAIPSDYRRILRAITGDTHSDVIRGRLRHFPDKLLSDWLAEVEEIGFISSVPVDPTQEPDFGSLLQTGEAQGAEATSPEDLRRIESQAHAAGMALDHAGVFLAADRLQNREPLNKDAAETTVLIVEDDPDQLALADLRMSMAGYRVRVARDYKELTEEFRTQPLPDLVLLDVMLPNVNGFEILAAMRRHPKFALLPVVMLTAFEAEESIRHGLNLGADGYVTKPYSKSILAQTIRTVLKHA